MMRLLEKLVTLQLHWRWRDLRSLRGPILCFIQHLLRIPLVYDGSPRGQNGWSDFGPGGVSVESFFADTGSQAVFVDGGAVSETGPYYTTNSTGPLVDLSADLSHFQFQHAERLAVWGAGSRPGWIPRRHQYTFGTIRL